MAGAQGAKDTEDIEAGRGGGQGSRALWGAERTCVLILWKKAVRAIRGYGQRRSALWGRCPWGLQRGQTVRDRGLTQPTWRS